MLRELAAAWLLVSVLVGCQESTPLTLVSRHFETCIRSDSPVELELDSGIDSQLGTIVVDGVTAGIHLGAHPQDNDLFASFELDEIDETYRLVRTASNRFGNVVVYASRVTKSDFNFVRLGDGGSGATTEDLQQIGEKLARCDGDDASDYVEPLPLSGVLNDASSWRHHCTIDRLSHQSEESLEFLAALAKTCDARDACVLACVRSGCARRMGGSCGHACGAMGVADPAVAADRFASRTLPFCHGIYNEPYDD